MPTFGWMEMLVVAVVAIVVVGPKELPRLMRTAGQWAAKARGAARDFQNAFEDMARESEIQEMRQKMAELKKLPQNLSGDDSRLKHEIEEAFDTNRIWSDEDDDMPKADAPKKTGASDGNNKTDEKAARPDNGAAPSAAAKQG